MGKIFSLLIVFLFAINNCFAIELELSDVITQAREAAKLERKQSDEQIKEIRDISNENNNKQKLISNEEKTQINHTN